MIEKIDFNRPIQFFFKELNGELVGHFIIKPRTDIFDSFINVLMNDLIFQDLIFNVGQVSLINHYFVEVLSFPVEKLEPFLEVYKEDVFFNKCKLLLSQFQNYTLVDIIFDSKEY